MERRREELAAAFDERFGEGLPRLLSAVPTLVPQARLERKPVVGEGEFVWGQVITTPERAEGAPVSDLVALVLAQIDGQRTIADVFDLLGAHLPSETLDQLRPGIVQALRLLHVEGVIERFDEETPHE